MSLYPLFYNEPEEVRGRWRTYCNQCEWADAYVHAYANECDCDTCEECGSDDVIDINEDMENA